MPHRNQRSVTLPRDIVDDVEEILNNHPRELRRQGIKKISHMLERSWLWYKDNRLPLIVGKKKDRN